MRTIKVDATNSTNSFLRNLYRENPMTENLCLVAREQIQGRGQRGTAWVSEAGKNLTFSLFFRHAELEVKQQFKLSALVSLAILGALKKVGLENLLVKWPNDILAGNDKIGGVLIENFLKNDRIHASIIGIGLNVNQEDFGELPNASSLKNRTGKSFDLDDLLTGISNSVESKLLQLDRFSDREIWKRYHENLFRNGKTSTFQLPNGEKFVGIIQGVDEEGRLQISTEDFGLRNFAVKEIRLLY